MMQMNDKAQRFVCMLLCGWIALCLYSCHDGQLAEELEGTWHTSYTMKDENGIPYTEEQKVKFMCVESNSKDGGLFMEQVTAEIENEEENINVRCKTICTISGEWEIIGGDLYMTYNLSSMDVEVKDMNYELSENTALGFDILGIDRIKLEDNITEEIRRNSYREMYKVYQQSNKETDQGFCFEDLSIEGDSMSYNTSDFGRIKWMRIK